MEVTLTSITPDIEKHIERCGRTCYQSHNKITDDSAQRFIKMLIKSGHESVIEHGVATFKISGVSRALSHQLVRHRLASPSQQSQRYVKENQFQYVIPESIKNSIELCGEYHELMHSIQSFYTKAVTLNVKPEDARFVLPNACCTELVLTANMREWRHILKERLAPGAQWEIKELSLKILTILKELAPNIFYDFEV